MRYPRYTTFGDDELVAAVKTLTPTGQSVPDAPTRSASRPTEPRIALEMDRAELEQRIGEPLAAEPVAFREEITA
jgi:hypothetical protein